MMDRTQVEPRDASAPREVDFLVIGGGTARLAHASDFLVNTVGQCPNGCCSAHVALGFTSEPADGSTGERHIGLYVGLKPDEARTLAADLLTYADKLDEGRGKQ